jgi:hypothetical protein
MDFQPRTIDTVQIFGHTDDNTPSSESFNKGENDLLQQPNNHGDADTAQ